MSFIVAGEIEIDGPKIFVDLEVPFLLRIFKGKATMGLGCIVPPCPPPKAYMIDFSKLPEVDEEYLQKAREAEAAEKALSGGLIGSPDTIRKKLRKFETSNIDQVILLNQAGKNTHDDICSSLELFATEVMPQLTG